MSEKEIKDIWMNANEGEQISFDLSQLLANLNLKTKKIDRALVFRDAREIIAAVFVMFFFGYKSTTMDLSLTQVGFILMSIWAAYVIYRLLDVRKYKKIADLSNSFKDQLLQQKFYLQQQAQLLDNIMYWYLGPFAVIYLLIVVGRLDLDEPLWVFISSLLISLVIMVVITWGGYVLNKKAAKTAYTPLIESIDNVLLQLEDD